MATTGKLVEVFFEKAIETYEHQLQMADMVELFKPPSGSLQNAGNVVWRSVQQHAPVINGWDMTGLATSIIEETYPAILGEPANDIFTQRADDMRDMQFWERRGEQSGMRQATELNKRVAALVANTGSLFYRANAASGYDFIAEAQAILNERQASSDMRYFILNDRDTKAFGSDLAGRQTLQGRPENTWKTGQIGSNVAEFDLYTGSFLPNLLGGADPATTITADVSEKPEGGTVTGSILVDNKDYRLGTLPVAASASYNVGDRITIGAVESVGLADKTATGQLMTFVIVEITSGTSIKVFPKPIALDDPALSVLEKAYANINTQIKSADTVNRINIDASARTNIFWAKDSIEVTCGDIPLEKLNEFGRQNVISSTMSNGQRMYMAYDSDISTLMFTARLFTWYSPTNKNPSANGVGIRF